MRKLIVSMVMIVFLTACSWKDVIDLVVPSKSGGINTELVVGDKKQSVNTEIGGQKAATIVNNNEAPFWLIGLGMLGWLLPSPQEMLRMWRTRNGA